MKKIISFFCAISLLIGIAPLNTLAFHDIEQSKSEGALLLEKCGFSSDYVSLLALDVEEDLNDLSFLGIANNKIEIADIDENSIITYRYSITDDTTDKYKVTKLPDGSVVVDITEGNLSDQITRLADGTVLINGIDYGAIVSPRRMSNTEYSRSRMGSVADYTKYLGKTSNANVELSKKIVSYTITALCTLLATCFGIPSKFATLMAEVSKSVLRAANAGNPTSKSVSYEQHKYERYDSIGTDRYYRYIAYCYPAVNFGGTVSQEIYYQHTYFT